MNSETTKLLSYLAAKLGTTVECLWPKLVGHARVEAWVEVLFGTLGMITLVLVMRWALKTIHANDDALPFAVGAVVACGFAAIILPIIVACAVPDIFYPEAAAIHALIPR